MADKKISEVTPKGAQLEDDDLLIVSEFNGATYDTKSVTGINVRPYKTVMFTISQTGTSAPTKDFSYETEVTQTFTFSRTAAGIYELTSSSALFTSAKTFINISLGGNGVTANIGAFQGSTTSIIFYTTNSTTGAYADDILSSATLEIKIIK